MRTSAIWYTTAGVLATAAVLLVYPRPEPPQANPRNSVLEIRAADAGDRLRLQWNSNLADVQRAERAVLEVTDGSQSHSYAVEPAVLRSGQLEYMRHSDDVLLALTLYTQGKPGLSGNVRVVGPPVAPAATMQPAPAKQATAKAAKRTGSRSRRRTGRTRVRRRSSLERSFETLAQARVVSVPHNFADSLVKLGSEPALPERLDR
jgi:hypothetical protein